MTLADWRPGCLELDGVRLDLDECLRLLPGKRLAARARLDGKPVFAKLYFHSAHRDAAENERNNMRTLAQAGVRVPACEDVLHGEGVSVLLVEWLEGAAGLEPHLREGADTVIDDLLRQLATLYRAGYYQADLHPDNFLLSGEKVWVVDCDEVRRLPRSGRRRRRVQLGNLGLLCAQAPLPQSELLRDRINRFLELNDGDRRRLEKALRGARQHRIRRARRKWLRDCSAIARHAGTGRDWLVDRSINAGEIEPLLERPESFEPVKRASRISVYRAGDRIIKHYRDTSVKARLKKMLGLGSARKSWVMGWTLSLLGVPTPRPLAWARRADGSSVVVYPRLEGMRLAEVMKQDSDYAEAIWPQVLRWLTLFGEAGVWHGDMKAQNILLPEGQPWFIDLDAAGWSRFGFRSRRRNRRDRKRFEKNRIQFGAPGKEQMERARQSGRGK